MTTSDCRTLYLDLMKKSLTFLVYGESYLDLYENGQIKLVRPDKRDLERRANGRDWPGVADTMIGLKRLDNLQSCIEDVLAKNVPGHLVEAEVWRGGASIFMRSVLKACEITDRLVWVVDSFSGLPPPNLEKYPMDAGDKTHTFAHLSVSLEQVKSNFSRYGLMDDQVRFLKGWFRDTLPTLSDQRWAIIRLDGDMYESTMDSLTHLYANLSSGGYIIIDDYGAISACRQAVHDYRDQHGIREEIRSIDWTGVFWQRR